MLVVVPDKGEQPPAEEVIARLAPHFAKWQLSDDVIYVDEIPHTAIGKISKLKLREMLNEMDYRQREQREAG